MRVLFSLNRTADPLALTVRLSKENTTTEMDEPKDNPEGDSVVGIEGGNSMIRKILFAAICGAMLGFVTADSAEAQQAYGTSWGAQSANNWDRFYHYPYVYYPQNYRSKDYYRSADSLYYRYPQEMRVPVYNRKWHNFYPTARPYHRGHQFVLDVF